MKVRSVRPAVALTLALGWLVAPGTAAAPADTNAPTFTREVAPILFQHCAPCHRPGGAAPFPLLSYADAREHGRELARATAKRTMPPWLPEPGHGEFLGARRLADAELMTLQRWATNGMPEGRAEDLPPVPAVPAEWPLGTPDLVVELPEAYPLGATGPDEYRNFVVPLPAGTNRFVRALDFHPRSPAVHHARFLFDSSGDARRRDSADPVCGFTGMMPPGKLPPGQIIGWTPGRQPTFTAPGLQWPLDGQGDLIVQLHLRRTGRPESIRPRLGFYLTNRPPDRVPASVGLVAQTIDIPAGATNYAVTRSLTLPADSDLLAVMPHAHYLAREVELTATRPDRPAESLLLIRNWRFPWQDEYRYAQPVALPRGTRLDFRMTFDNSSANPDNPNQPPKPVTHGPNATDEMAEVWLQLQPRNPAGADALARLHRDVSLNETAAAFAERVRRDPKNAGAHLELGKALGALGRQREAFEQLAAAVQLNPELVEAHHYIGLSFLQRGMAADAATAFSQALELQPDYQRSVVGLGLAAAALGEKEEAVQLLRRALELNPEDDAVRRKLAELQAR